MFTSYYDREKFDAVIQFGDSEVGMGIRIVVGVDVEKVWVVILVLKESIAWAFACRMWGVREPRDWISKGEAFSTEKGNSSQLLALSLYFWQEQMRRSCWMQRILGDVVNSSFGSG